MIREYNKYDIDGDLQIYCYGTMFLFRVFGLNVVNYSKGAKKIMTIFNDSEEEVYTLKRAEQTL